MIQSLIFLIIILLCSCGQRDNKANDSINSNSTLSATTREYSKPTDTIINKLTDKNLKFKIDSLSEEGSKVLTIYRNEKKILSHVLFKSDGDCSSVNVELGNYIQTENEIIFYSYWAATDRQNIAIYPFGFRKQTYRIDETGKFIKLHSEIFIEDNVEKEKGKELFYEEHSIWKHKGLAFIYKTPQNDFQKKVKADYIKSIEKAYNGTFVFGKQKEILEKEVRNFLKTEIAENTDSWKYGDEYGYGTIKK